MNTDSLFWGTVGIVYNPNLIDDHLTFESWDDLGPNVKE